LDEIIISVIIPTHNSEQTIEKCITSLISQNFPRKKFEIIVVDDGSKDGTIMKAKKAGADQFIVTEQCFQGKARNIGVSKAKGNFLAFLDSDCAVKDEWLETISNELRKNKIVVGPVLNGNEQNLISWAEYFLEFSRYNERRNRSIIRIPIGANQAITKKAFDLAGGFPDLRFAEDAVFGESLKRVGIKVNFVPELKIIHFGTTEKSKFLSKFELHGKYFVRTYRNRPSLWYGFLAKSKWFIPGIFLGNLASRTFLAFKSGKTVFFIRSFPIIISGITSYCKGILNEFKSQ